MYSPVFRLRIGGAGRAAVLAVVFKLLFISSCPFFVGSHRTILVTWAPVRRTQGLPRNAVTPEHLHIRSEFASKQPRARNAGRRLQLHKLFREPKLNLEYVQRRPDQVHLRGFRCHYTEHSLRPDDSSMPRPATAPFVHHLRVAVWPYVVHL